MGLLEILISSFIVILVLVIFMQPVNILSDISRDSLIGAGSTIKYGTNSDGNVIAIGTSSALPDLSSVLIWFLPLSIVIGFIVWVVRYGRGGQYEGYYNG